METLANEAILADSGNVQRPERTKAEQEFIGALALEQMSRAAGGVPEQKSDPGGSGPPGTQKNPLGGVAKILPQLNFDPEAGGVVPPAQ